MFEFDFFIFNVILKYFFFIFLFIESGPNSLDMHLFDDHALKQRKTCPERMIGRKHPHLTHTKNYETTTAVWMKCSSHVNGTYYSTKFEIFILLNLRSNEAKLLFLFLNSLCSNEAKLLFLFLHVNTY